MPTTLRRGLRRTAWATGTLALVLGSSGCLGGTDEEPDPTPTAEGEQTGGQEPDASDGGGEGGSEAFSEEELAAASERFVEMLQVMDDGDWEATCGFVLDPETGAPPTGDRLAACVDGAEGVMGGVGDQLQPGMFDAIDASMVEAEDTGDGAVSIRLMGRPAEVTMAQGSDGEWYCAIPF